MSYTQTHKQFTVHNPLYFISHIPVGNMTNIYILLHATLGVPSLNAISLFRSMGLILSLPPFPLPSSIPSLTPN